MPESSIRRRLLFSAVAFLLFLLIAEVVLRLVYFNLSADHALAVAEAHRDWRRLLRQARTEREVDAITQLRERAHGYRDAIYEETGTDLREELAREYESYFARFVEQANAIEARTLLLYLPSREPGDATPESRRERWCRDFYASLAERYDIDFLDLAPALAAYPLQQVYLWPDNGHLSRYGNQRVAEVLAVSLDGYRDYRSPYDDDGEPVLCGDLRPHDDAIWDQFPLMPYRVYTNARGFRMREELDVPKQRQRVLVLGDSFTFGPYLPNTATYPALLGRLRPNLEVINAGIAGYSIMDQQSLFSERAHHVAPDIVVLQVLDNDIDGLLWFVKSAFDRKGRKHEPSELERAFFDHVISRNQARATPALK